jgi:hypothetical protein
MYATYNSSLLLDDWSTPAPVVTGNLTADMNPQLISFNGSDANAVCIWQDAKVALEDSDSLKKYLSQMEIAVSIYEDSSWGTDHKLTNNEILDRSPRIAGPNTSNLMAVWISNDCNNPWGKTTEPNDTNEALNDIKWSRWNGSSWSGGTVDSDLGTILGTDLAYDGNDATYVFCIDPNSGVDANDDPNHAKDQELYIATYSLKTDTWEEPSELTDDSSQPVSDSAPRLAYDMKGNLMLFWVRGNDIRMAVEPNFTDLKTDPNLYSDVAVTPGASIGVKDFDVVTDNRELLTGEPNQIALVWSDASFPSIELNEPDPNQFKVGYDIWLAYYEPSTGLWSVPRPLTVDDAAERFISGAFDSQGDLLCIYDKTQTDYNDNHPAFDIEGETVTVTGVPEPNRSDLYYMKYQLGVDLSVAVGDIRIEPPNPLPGTEPNISIMIMNVGEYPASGVEVDFSYKDIFTFEDPNGIFEPNIVQLDPNFIIADGNCPKDPLVGGDQAIIEIEWSVPSMPDPNQHLPNEWLPDPNRWDALFSRILIVEASFAEGSKEQEQERDPNNDTASCETMRPDLTISEMAVQKADSNYIITSRVANHGALKANDIELVLREDDPNTGTAHGYTTITEIAAGAFYDVSFTVPEMITAYAIVDPNETIDEFNEDNNIRSVMVAEHFSGDFEPDGDVDMDDYVVVAEYWMCDYCAEPNFYWCEGADLDKSGDVDFTDIGILANSWLEGVE